jgi:uncharacterized membrane protein YcfT
MTMSAEKSRIEWVDYAKGICIILVVMMHTTLGIEKSLGHETWLHPFIEWARPFRMPDFFLISGLFLSSRINKPWRSFLDMKVVHFAYFYVLWMTIQFYLRSGELMQAVDWLSYTQTYLIGFIEPYGTLWFIYLLAVFFIVTKLTKAMPAILVFGVAVVLESLRLHTSWTLIDEFAGRYVYFFTGYWMAARVFGFATETSKRSIVFLLSGLTVWAFANHLGIAFEIAQLPIFSLIFGLVGTAAVITFGVVLSRLNFASFIRYCGTNSIVIYLSFSLFMAALRTMMLKLMPNMDGGLASLLITGLSVFGSLGFHWLTLGTMFDFLFHRPNWARLSNEPKQWHSVGHVSKFLYKTR